MGRDAVLEAGDADIFRVYVCVRVCVCVCMRVCVHSDLPSAFIHKP